MVVSGYMLNETARLRDHGFSHVPGRGAWITIKDRLRVLLPNDPDDVYWERDPGALPPVGDRIRYA